VRDGSAATLAFTGFSATGLLLVVSILLLVGGVLLLGLGRRHSARRVDQRT
jgi:hypothetical protein